MAMKIGELSKASGVHIKMIRHYEAMGLLPKARRSQSGYRMYTPKEVQYLVFIKNARDLGFTMKDIEKLLELWLKKSRTSKEVRELAEIHLQNLESKIESFQRMVQNLRATFSSCTNDSRPDCSILTSLESSNVN